MCDCASIQIKCQGLNKFKEQFQNVVINKWSMESPFLHTVYWSFGNQSFFEFIPVRFSFSLLYYFLLDWCGINWRKTTMASKSITLGLLHNFKKISCFLSYHVFIQTPLNTLHINYNIINWYTPSFPSSLVS